MARQDSLRLRFCLWVVRVFSLLVPRAPRSDWRAEWEAEFRHREGRTPVTWSGRLDLVRRAFGALPDAAWIRRQFTADSEIVHDVRHGLRMLWSAPAFGAAAVMILALGLGGTVAVGTLLDTLFFRPLPYRNADEIVTVWQRSPAGERDDVAPANFLDWRERATSFSHLAAVVPHSYDYVATGEPEVFFGAAVTEGFLEAFGTNPLMGRGFEPADHVRGAPKVALITHGLWQRRFGADPGIVNTVIELDGAMHTIVGVLPPGFRPQLLPRPGELTVWTPKVIQEYEPRIRDSAWWNVVGRLAPGVSIEQARSEMAAVAAALAREHPRTNERVGVEVLSLREHLMGGMRVPLLVMLAGVVLVLVIGCANVASLLLARGLHREREFAIRAALGARRGRLVRQLVAESLLLACIAAGVGIALAHWFLAAIVALAPAGVLRLQDAALDGRAVGFAAVLTTVTALAFGILPALQFSRAASDRLRERQPSGRRASARRVLVAAEVALAVVLLTGAGLLVRSFERLLSVDPGFSAANTVVLQVFAHDRHNTPERVRAYFRETIDRLARLPGVDAAGAVSAMPFTNANIDIRSTFEIIGQPPRPPDEQRGVYLTIATPGVFEALSVPLREGRLLDVRDTARTPLVALISDALRRREWGDADPLGRRIRVEWQGRPLEAEIVGVIGQMRHDGLDTPPRPEVFFAHEQVPFASMTYVLKADGPPGDLITAARSAVWSVDPQQTFYQVGAVDEMVAASLATQRFSTTLMTVVAAMALVLSAIGLYGVVSFAAAQRTREIGVRMALGADRASIRRLVLRDGGLIVAAGIVVGIAGSLVSMRYLQALLFEVRAEDPATLAGVCLLLTAVALAACYVPARRAMNVDPVVALRAD